MSAEFRCAPFPLAVLLLVAGACWPAAPEGDPSLLLTVAVSPTPATLGPARVLVSLADSSERPVQGAQVVVTGRLTGDGTSPVVEDTAREEAPGRYVAADFPFAVAGEWVLEARALLADGRRAAADHPIRPVRRPRSER